VNDQRARPGQCRVVTTRSERCKRIAKTHAEGGIQICAYHERLRAEGRYLVLMPLWATDWAWQGVRTGREAAS